MQRRPDQTAEFASALTADEQDVVRILQICNACRYCESFCAVFPAMIRLRDFGQADAHYLANLCHNCGACLHACQYAPPHEFAVDTPRAMARVRLATYRDFAWPPAFGRLYAHAGLTVALSLAVALALFLFVAVSAGGGLTNAQAKANFYAIFPHDVLAIAFGLAFTFAIVALGVGATRFWRAITPSTSVDVRNRAAIARARGPAALEALSDIATMKYLGGHGEGCNERDEHFTLARRHCHHATFYGFVLCFASTSVATIYHYGFGLHAPYAWTSLPVALGLVGGVGLLVGSAGLLWLNLHRDPAHGDRDQRGMDRGFIVLLLLTAATGLALLALRATQTMPFWLAIHLGVVMALFVTLPYGKFAHAAFRAAALLKFTIEKRLPTRLSRSGD